MKKSKVIYKALMCFVCVSCAAFINLFCCCSQNVNSNITPSQNHAKLLPPYIVSFNTFLWWDAVQYATGYEIYCDNQFLEEVKENRYDLAKVYSDCNYEVIAKNDASKSKKSNRVKVSKNSSFNTDEIFNCKGGSGGEIKIPSNIRKVINVESANSRYIDFIIEQRTDDLIFEFRDTQFFGSILTLDGKISRLTNNYNVIIEVMGECKINGNNGTDGKSFNVSEYDNQCRDGYDGNSGQTCITVPSLIVRGTGTLTITGGNGGNGGNGSNAYGVFNTAKPGKGSHGGNGGTGLLTEYLILDALKEDFILSITDGRGGKRGVLGSYDGNILGTSSTLVNSSYWYFTDGKNGQSQVGKSILTKGKLIINGEQL